jgi:hypothetical protein
MPGRAPRLATRPLLLLAQAAALVLVYRCAAGVAARRRPAPAPAVPASPPADLRPLPGEPRLLLPAGDAGSAVHADGLAAVGGQRAVVLGRGRTVLGSGASADLRVDDAGVAAEHAELVSDESSVHLRDLTGTGRVTVDGVPVLDADLVDGNRISVGGHDLVFRREGDYVDVGRQGGEGS